MFGVEIISKNGHRTWIDPVSIEPTEENGVLIVTNTFYGYNFRLEDIEKWFKYDLCPKCEHDVRSFGCTDGECLNQ